MPAPAYTEDMPSPRGEWYTNAKGIVNFRAKRILRCTWGDRAALIAWLGTEAGCTYPHADGTALSLVRGIQSEGFAKGIGSGNLMSYSHATLTVSYDTAGPQWVNGVSMEEWMQPHQFEVWTPKLWWADGKKNTENYCKTVAGWKHVTSVSKALTVPSNAGAYIGMCNQNTKSTLTLGYSFAAQTLLYNPPSVSSHTDSGGTRYSYQFEHIYHPGTWNKFWRQDTNAYETMYTTAAGNTPYVCYPATW
jgi:hypothetical protein